MRTIRLPAMAAVFAIAAMFSSSGSVAAEGSKTFKIGYILSVDSQLGAGAKAFADELAGRTGGRLSVEHFPNSALGGEVEMLKGVQLGTIDLAVITGAPLPNIVPEVGVFNIPFLFRDATHAHVALDGPIGQEYLQKFKAKGIVALAWAENGMRHITNSKREVKGPDDLKGLKLRLPQSEVMLTGFRTLGAEVAPLPFPQLYGALQSGQFDGQENPIGTILSANFSQVQKYLTVSGHVYDPAVIVMSADAWDDLSEADRNVVMAAARIGGEASRKYAAEAQAKGIATLVKAGMTVTTDIDRARFAAALSSAQPEFEKKFGAVVIAKLREAK